ncbi:MAG: squalene/phytoene synthase family protein [Hyphomicrobiales bacterium]|nr:squalene/phytoene synthase family protein [Hyphomicrobiales bacterium]
MEAAQTPQADRTNAAPDREAQLAAHYSHCEQLLREHDRDRWLACMFAPGAARPRLHALYAFNMEIARVRESVRDPMPGEIRLQWWVDAIEGEARGDVRNHPVADALIDTIRRLSLPRRAFTDMIEARRFDLYDDPMTDMESLEAYCGRTASALFRLAAIIVADGGEPGGADAAGYAGVAYALTGLLRAFPWHASRGQMYVPAESLEQQGVTPAAALVRPANPGLLIAMSELRAHAARRFEQATAALHSVAPKARAAFVPLSIVPLYLRTMESAGYNPFTSRTDASQWRRQLAMWRFSRRY